MDHLGFLASHRSVTVEEVLASQQANGPNPPKSLQDDIASYENSSPDIHEKVWFSSSKLQWKKVNALNLIKLL